MRYAPRGQTQEAQVSELAEEADPIQGLIDELARQGRSIEAMRAVLDKFSEEIMRREAVLGDTRQGLKRACGDFSAIVPRDIIRLRKWERWFRRALDDGERPDMSALRFG